MNEKKYLKAADVQRIYGLGLTTVYRLMDEGRIPYIVPQGLTRPRMMKREDVEAFFAACEEVKPCTA